MSSDSAIFSPESADGLMPLDSPECRMSSECGPVHAPVSLLAESGKVLASQTSDTYGHSGKHLSKCLDLQLSLENRLQPRKFGSTWCSLIWRVATTPQGRRIFQLVPSVHATSASGFGLLPTPTKRDGRTLKGSQPPRRNPTSGDPLAWHIAKLLNIFEGRLNPIAIGLLMGYSERVTRLAPTVTPSSRK